MTARPTRPDGRPWPVDPAPEMVLRAEVDRLRAEVEDLKCRLMAAELVIRTLPPIDVVADNTTMICQAHSGHEGAPMKAHIILPPVEVKAGQKTCPIDCSALYDTFRCQAWQVTLEMDEQTEPLRCPACLAAERPAFGVLIIDDPAVGPPPPEHMAEVRAWYLQATEGKS